jgi:hypothetical protein
MNFVSWIQAAARLDYGLTAVFLILERTLPEPTSKDKGALLSIVKKALLEYGQAASKFVVHEYIQRTLRDLETPHIKIKVASKGIRGVSLPKLDSKPKKPTLGASPRQSEMDWLTRNKDVSGRYEGQWNVLEKDELVANDADYRKAREVASQRGIKRPFIIFVPRKESGGFMGI